MPRIIGVCESASCAQSGSAQNIVAIEDIISCLRSNSPQQEEGQCLGNDGAIRVMSRNCLGACEYSPNIVYRNPPKKPQVFTELNQFEKITSSIGLMLEPNEELPPYQILHACELHWSAKKLIDEGGDLKQAIHYIDRALLGIETIDIDNTDDDVDGTLDQGSGNIDDGTFTAPAAEVTRTATSSSNEMEIVIPLVGVSSRALLYLKFYVSLLLSKGKIYLLLKDGIQALQCADSIIERLKTLPLTKIIADKETDSLPSEGSSGSGGGDDDVGDVPITAYLLRADAIMLNHTTSFHEEAKHLENRLEKKNATTNDNQAINTKEQHQGNSIYNINTELDASDLPSSVYWHSPQVLQAYQYIVDKDLALKNFIQRKELKDLSNTSGQQKQYFLNRLPYKEMKRVKDTITNFM